MKKIILALAATLGLASAASAATYSTFVTATPFRAPGQPGLQTRAVVLSPSGPQNFNGATYSFDLANIGDTVTFDAFGLVHYDAPLGTDDLIASPSTATFDFGAFGTRTISGVTYGVGSVGSAIAYAVADYTSTISFNVGGGLRLLVELADFEFGSGDTGVFVNGRDGVGFATATITLAAVPLPATLPLAFGAIGLLGFAARRRKAAAQA